MDLNRIGAASGLALALVGPALGQGAPPFIWQHAVTDGGIKSMDFSPNGSYLATGEGYFNSFFIGEGDGDGAVRLFDAATGEQISFYDPGPGKGDDVEALAFAPTSDRLAIGALIRQVVAIPSLQPIYDIDSAYYFERDVDWSPDGRYIALMSDNPYEPVRIVDAAANRVVTRLWYADEAADLEFSPDGRYLAVGRIDVQIYRTSDWQIEQFLPNVNGSSNMVISWAPDSRRLAVLRSPMYQDAGDTRVYDVTTGALLTTIPVPQDVFIWEIDFAPDGSCIAGAGTFSAYRGGRVYFWSSTDGSLKKLYDQGLLDSCEAIQYSPDARKVAVGFNAHEQFMVGVFEAPKMGGKPGPVIRK